MTDKTIAVATPVEVEEFPSKSKYSKNGKGYTLLDGTHKIKAFDPAHVEYLKQQNGSVSVLVGDGQWGLFLKRIPALEDEVPGGGGVKQSGGSDVGTPAVTGQASGTGVGGVEGGAHGAVAAAPAGHGGGSEPPSPVPEHSDIDLRITRAVGVKAAAGLIGQLWQGQQFTGLEPALAMFWQLADDIVQYQFDGLVPGGAASQSIASQSFTTFHQDRYVDDSVPGAAPVSAPGDESPSPVPEPIQEAEKNLKKAGLLCDHSNTVPAKGPLGAKGWTTCAGCGLAFRPDGGAA